MSPYQQVTSVLWLEARAYAVLGLAHAAHAIGAGSNRLGNWASARCTALQDELEEAQRS